jgi:hypothetical protein
MPLYFLPENLDGHVKDQPAFLTNRLLFFDPGFDMQS